MQTGRLFAFGCSFTEYRWPTWADIWGLGGQFSGYWNMASQGSSNERIAYNINEFCERFGSMLNESDIIAVMWSSLNHERYIMRDYNLIHFADQVMEQTGAQVLHLQIIDIRTHADASGSGETTVTQENWPALKELFGGTLSKIKLSMHEEIFEGDWNSKLDHNHPDITHRLDSNPTPLEHLMYLRGVIPGDFVISPEIEHEVNYINNRIISNNDTFTAEENYHKQYFTDILPKVRDYPEKFL